MLSFEELTEARRYLQSFCLLHVPSLLAVQSGISFKLLPSEKKNLDDGELHHPTTTTTCLSSLYDCPPQDRGKEFARAEKVRSELTNAALKREDWTSEGSAGVYCRCRAFPMVISCSTSFDNRFQSHLAAILGQLDKTPERFGIGEAGSDLPEEQWYPPNAFHTYWTLEILELIKSNYKTQYAQLAVPEALDLDRRSEGMLIWARQQLGSQLGLHSSSPQSSVLDSDQLAWSLAIFMKFDKTLNVNLENRDFLKQAFRCLFSTQTDGTWRHYKPLFHYLDAGNAYCYVFETFTALLQCAFREEAEAKAEAKMIRDLLKPYCQNLIDLWRYADSTKIPLRPDGKEIGWCSGHRTNVTEPESWASASVFSYAQALRRLIGIWCREEALNNLNTPQSRFAAEDAAKEMIKRGKTWEIGRTPVSEQLWTLFINPVRMHKCDDKLEPDSQPIEENQSRSAILFGPPGTSKTTLVRLMADVIGWNYVELHASHFVADGLTQVQKTADKIFKQLSELDHTVVLFDEIDELVRERDMEKDAFGRFLTTSMLPKLAELWEARKILYFVATNHINYFDSAIIRSHRFDALILVSPPSFQAKIDRLKKLLPPTARFELKEQEIQKVMDLAKSEPAAEGSKSDRNHLSAQPQASSDWREQRLDPEFALAKFVLLRWDELEELAYHIAAALKAKSPETEIVSLTILQEALDQIADSQWRKNKSYADYARDLKSERRDYSMLKAWEVVKESATVPAVEVVSNNGKTWLARAVDSLNDIEISGYQLIPETPGSVRIQPSASAQTPPLPSGSS